MFFFKLKNLDAYFYNIYHSCPFNIYSWKQSLREGAYEQFTQAWKKSDATKLGREKMDRLTQKLTTTKPDILFSWENWRRSVRNKKMIVRNDKNFKSFFSLNQQFKTENINNLFHLFLYCAVVLRCYKNNSH